MHIAAVFASNFVNHLYVLTEGFCEKEQIDFHLLAPIIRETGERIDEAELHRLSGECLLTEGLIAGGRAESSFREAIGIARRQETRWWELRATTNLSRLLQDAGRGDEARAMLAEIYAWFTEGFDTADLKDAKALLDQLNA